ncbi:hypothetical protein IT399_02935 [Candidatus Nomurabacteria bacterium]|nr:hypothetical protein [Candidatus Nomurabacteria bacterium]
MSNCRLPFVGARVESHRGSISFKLEKRGDVLYLDGKSLSLFLSKKQQKGRMVVGHELRQELEPRGNNVNASVLDYLVDHPEVWPESWKKDAYVNPIFAFFWDDIFRDPVNDNLFVRYGFWGAGKVVSSSHRVLDSLWGYNNPAVSSS